MPLTPDQKGRTERARAVLGEAHEYDAGSLAAHIGKVEYWLRDLLSMVDDLTEKTPPNVSSIARKYGG